MSSEKAFGRERPILFNAKMVKAILEGRKTQTRRLVKGLPLAEPWFTVEDGKPMMCDENGEWYPAERFSAVQPGDILWVRKRVNTCLITGVGAMYTRPITGMMSL